MLPLAGVNTSLVDDLTESFFFPADSDRFIFPERPTQPSRFGRIPLTFGQTQ